MIRVTFDDTPNDQPAHYSPRKLPGMEEATPDVQGLLWADVGTCKKPRATSREVRNDTPDLFTSK